MVTTAASEETASYVLPVTAGILI